MPKSADNQNKGAFRANNEALVTNHYRLVDPGNPGTPSKTVIEIDTTGKTKIDGFRYTDKDGATKLRPPFDLNDNHVPVYKTMPIDADVIDLQLELGKIVRQHEVEPVLKVERSGSTLTVTHIGAGDLVAVVVDGADEDTAPV